MTGLDTAVNRQIAAVLAESRASAVVPGEWNAQPTLTTPAFLAGVAISSAVINAYNAGINAG
ncbi:MULTISPECIES: hypothetical protein [Curtobacterium]|uniref:Uncharacterized protein n=2 Tax=Curtobacterium TaxID=2034 RepID=A0A9Q2W5L8_9MICO|nr:MULTISPECIES: hypothetical protein [Curtobacterium]MBT1542815.1 hypothetical protein [Curtobacterium flaccumfaciens pv. flaccumfaciens]MBT1610551.1 hypothetical protein [Curtobacterium flaccumfaciens pv. poinsettiae]MCS6564697.1 hypothetical protein [Curtobacterium flaccumfaciens pv. flaccumfaciens]MCU0115132.1 hypothetical protein [Curtobacterium flaccumfaciens]MCX2849059.1 hypothetical protein [Curtobacterium flaccumfaciens pv. poinsettiae]